MLVIFLPSDLGILKKKKRRDMEKSCVIIEKLLDKDAAAAGLEKSYSVK